MHHSDSCSHTLKTVGCVGGGRDEKRVQCHREYKHRCLDCFRYLKPTRPFNKLITLRGESHKFSLLQITWSNLAQWADQPWWSSLVEGD